VHPASFSYRLINHHILKKLFKLFLSSLLFNLGSHTTVVSASWQELKLHGPQEIRDLWRQKTIGVFNGEFAAQVPSHGVVLVRITAVQPSIAHGIRKVKTSARE
jgi:hypothetical protein